MLQQTSCMNNQVSEETIAHLNIGGLKNKVEILESYMLVNSISWCFLSESWLSPADDPPSPNLIINVPYMSRKTQTGHYPYGIGVLINPSLCSAQDFRLVKADHVKQFLLLEYRGISFACVYLPPNSPKKAVEDRLTFFLNRLDDVPLFLIGDLNSRLLAYGDHTQNQQGKFVNELADVARLTHIPSVRGLWTFRRGDHHSIPDHTFANDIALQFSPNLVIDEDCSISDHRPSLLSFSPLSFSPSPNISSRRTGHWNRWKLNDTTCKLNLLMRMESSWQTILLSLNEVLDNVLLDVQVRIDEAMKTVTTWLNSCLSSCIGRVGPSNRHTRSLTSKEVTFTQMWISSLSSRIATATEPVKSVLINTLTLAQSQLLTLQLEASRSDVADKTWNTLDSNSQQKLFKSFLSKKSNQSLDQLPNDPSSLEQYRAYYSSRYCGPLPETYDADWFAHDAIDSDDLLTFDVAQVDAALLKLPKGKAPGMNAIPNEVLTLGHRFLSPLLTRIFNFCSKHGVIPTEWTLTIISPIPKKTATLSIEDTRPISLTDTFRKTFEKLLLPYLTQVIEPLHVSQGGFRDRRGCLDQAAYLQEFISQSLHDELEIHMAFLDIKAAYDTVYRPLLWKKCRDRDVPAPLIRLLAALFDSNRAVIGVRGSNSEAFDLPSGLLQGSILSPILYALFIDDLATDLCRIPSSHTSSGLSLPCLLYADDIVLFSNDAAHLQALLNAAYLHSRLNGYLFNVSKCCSLSGRPMPFFLGTDPLPQSSSYLYLGFQFSIKGIDWENHFSRLITKALSTASQFKSLGLCSPTFSPTTVCSIFKTFIRPILEYGLALAPRRCEWIVQRGFNSCLRSLFALSKGTCLQALTTYVGIEPFVYRHHRLGVRWASQTAGKDERFAITEAKEFATLTYPAGSCFVSLLGNPLLDMDDLSAATFRSYLNSCWARIIDHRKAFGLLHAFGPLRRAELTRFLKKMSRSSQNSLLRWAVGADYGPWRACPNCGEPSSSRPHIEACVFHLDGEYEELFDSCFFTMLHRARSLANLELIGSALDIIRSL